MVAIGITKHCFGGLGSNIWNPALVGRAFVQLAYPQHVSLARWPWPAPWGLMTTSPDAITQATMLSKSGTALTTTSVAGWTVEPLWRTFLGLEPGSLGEVSALLLLLGGIYLIVRKYVDWRLPLGYILALVVFATLFAWSPRTGVAPWVNDFAETFARLRNGQVSFGGFLSDWLWFGGMQVFAGGVMLGAFYMATDMVTSPLTTRGQFIFGVGCGFLTAVIRFFAGYPEGVCYAILLMNTVRPYIDRYTRPRIIGQPA